MDNEAAKIQAANREEANDIGERMGNSLDGYNDENWPSEILYDEDHIVRQRTRFITQINGSAYDVADPFSIKGQLGMDNGIIHTETVSRDIAVERMSECRVAAFEKRLR